MIEDAMSKYHNRLEKMFARNKAVRKSIILEYIQMARRHGRVTEESLQTRNVRIAFKDIYLHIKYMILSIM